MDTIDLAIVVQGKRETRRCCHELTPGLIVSQRGLGTTRTGQARLPGGSRLLRRGDRPLSGNCTNALSTDDGLLTLQKLEQVTSMARGVQLLEAGARAAEGDRGISGRTKVKQTKGRAIGAPLEGATMHESHCSGDHGLKPPISQIRIVSSAAVDAR